MCPQPFLDEIWGLAWPWRSRVASGCIIWIGGRTGSWNWYAWWRCYKEYHQLVGLTSKNLFLQFWNLGIQDLSASMVSFWWGPFPWFVHSDIIFVFSHGREAEVWSLHLLITSYSHHEDSTLRTLAKPKPLLSKGPPPITIALGIRTLMWMLRERSSVCRNLYVVDFVLSFGVQA